MINTEWNEAADLAAGQFSAKSGNDGNRACDDVQSDKGQVADSSHVGECTTLTQYIVGL